MLSSFSRRYYLNNDKLIAIKNRLKDLKSYRNDINELDIKENKIKESFEKQMLEQENMVIFSLTSIGQSEGNFSFLLQSFSQITGVFKVMEEAVFSFYRIKSGCTFLIKWMKMKIYYLSSLYCWEFGNQNLFFPFITCF